MLAPLLAALLGAASGLPQQFSLPPAKPRRCAGDCAQRYRLPTSSDGTQTVKDRALADDGSKCDVVGARRCTSKRRTILRSSEDPMDTWRSTIGDN